MVSLPTKGAVEISKEELADFESQFGNNSENVCSQNRADDLKSDGSSSEGSFEGSFRTNLCPDWNSMSKEEKRAYMNAEKLRTKETLMRQMAAKRELERVKRIFGDEVND